MTTPLATPLVIKNARVLQGDGTFRTVERVAMAEGRFGGETSEIPSDAGSLNGDGMWLIPGVYDCHCHISWSDFHESDRATRSDDENYRLTAASLAATLRAGVTTVRDAGGAEASLRDAIARGELIGPRLQVSIDMIGTKDAGSTKSVRAAVERALAKGAQWIKLIATAGVASPAESVLHSNFTKAEFAAAVAAAREGGARVMVHTWGGDSLDWAIDSGAASIEHGIYLTAQQATRAAKASMTFVPTLTIYRYVRDMVAANELSGVPLERVAHVVEVHEGAVRLARDAGLSLALGSDFTTPAQHGTNLVEIASMMRAGLSSPEALLAATLNGARLLTDDEGGVISPGRRADAVLLTRDPSDPSTFEEPGNVAAVIKDGSVAYISEDAP